MVSSSRLTSSVGTSTPTVTSPITYSGTLGNFVGGVSGAFGCATCVLTTRALTIAGTAGQITSSAGGQDLSADRTWTLSLPNHVIFPGNFQVANSTTTNSTTTSQYILNLTAALALYDSNSQATEYAGTSCTNQFPRSLSATGAATCATVANTDLANSTISGTALGSNLADLTATNSTLTFSGSYNGGTARTVGLNLGNANTFGAGIQTTALNVTTGTSTFANGIQLSAGCFRTAAGTCLSTGGGSPGGSDTQVQFNDSSTFGGDAGLTFNKTTNVLTVGEGGSLTDSTAAFGPDTSNQWLVGYDVTDKSFAISSSTALGTNNARYFWRCDRYFCYRCKTVGL